MKLNAFSSDQTKPNQIHLVLNTLVLDEFQSSQLLNFSVSQESNPKIRLVGAKTRT